jgi:LPXTG-motif cell wall-anchored protein
MKKSLAAIGASVLGLAGALGASASSASAAPVPTPLPKCDDATQHIVNPDLDPTTASWYMTCIPQYGMGKAEFSITAPNGGFPAGYTLTDGHQTVVSSSPTSAQVQAYFDDFYTSDHDEPVYTGAFASLTQDVDDSTATTQTYKNVNTSTPMTAAFPISSVGLAGSAFPTAACSPDGETYEGEYVVNYAPVTTTFSEVIGTTSYKTTVTLTAPTLYLGLNFDTNGPIGFDASKALCATSAAGTLFAPNFEDFADSASTDAQVRAAVAAAGPISTADVPTGSEAWATIAVDAATNDTNTVTTLVPTTSGFFDSDPTSIASGQFAVTAASTLTLAETGVDPAPAGILGGSLAIVGFGAFLLGRRRRAVVRSH